MTEKVSEERILHDITNKLIFRTFLRELEVNQDSTIIDKNRIVVRKETEIFFAVGNTVRYCTLEDDNRKYSILDRANGDFEILLLKLNSLGTFLAVLGQKDIEIISLPNDLSSENPTTKVDSYKLQGVTGNINKVVWHSAIANDCCLVVLNDQSKIFAYDISISCKVVQLQFNLNKFDKFNGEIAKSLDFGSDANLSGLLTLYVATETSNIFALYPFIYPAAKLVTRRECVEKSLDEASYILDTIEETFPSRDLVRAPEESDLKKSISQQYEYYFELNKEFETSTLLKEYRRLWSPGPIELSVVPQNMTLSTDIDLQGPLVSGTRCDLFDMLNIGHDENCSFIVSLSRPMGGSSFLLTYYAQLTPLIMKWTSSHGKSGPLQHNKDSRERIDEPDNKRSEYVKPKRGFGFIDLESDSDSCDVKFPSSADSNDIKKDINVFWATNFSELSRIAVEQLTLPHDKEPFLSKLEEPSESFFIKINGAIIMADYSKWVEQLVYSSEAPEIKNEYHVIDEHKVPVSSFAVTKDFLKSDSKFLIVIRASEENSLSVIPFGRRPESTVLKEASATSEKFDHDEYESLLVQEPFEEIASQLKILHQTNTPENFKSSLTLKNDELLAKLNGSIQNLRALNTLSKDIIKTTSQNTSYILRLGMRMRTQQKELVSQIERLKELESNQDNESYVALKDTEAKISERQDRIDKRLKEISKKISRAIREIHYGRNLPLSDAEKRWFREVNSINALVNNPNEDSALISRMSKLTSQVEHIKSMVDTSSSQVSKADKMDEFQLNQNIHKIRKWLDEEGKVIAITKKKLDTILAQPI